MVYSSGDEMELVASMVEMVYSSGDEMEHYLTMI